MTPATWSDPTAAITTEADIAAVVCAIVARVSRADVSALRPDDDLVERLGVDSLLGLQILAAVETRFDVRLPDHELIHLRSVGLIAAAVIRTRTGAGS